MDQNEANLHFIHHLLQNCNFAEGWTQDIDKKVFKVLFIQSNVSNITKFFFDDFVNKILSTCITQCLNKQTT